MLTIASVPGYGDYIYGPPADTATLDALWRAPGNPARARRAVRGAARLNVQAGGCLRESAHPVLRPDQVVSTEASFTARRTYLHN